MASARAPSMGMTPKILPARSPFCPKRIFMAFENAPTEPSCAMRPKAISLATPVKPSNTMNTMKGIRNAAPPNSAIRYGKSQMQPMPTAEPTHEMMKANLLVKLSRPAFSATATSAASAVAAVAPWMPSAFRRSFEMAFSPAVSPSSRENAAVLFSSLIYAPAR